MLNGLKVKRNSEVICLLVVVFLSITTDAAYFDGCDFNYNINPGYSYLESPYYPNSYPPNTSCRYKFTAPLDYSITVNCTININKGTNGCSTEYFYLARDGDVLLRDSEQFCGAGTFIRQSIFRSVVLAYVSQGSFGNFRCQLYVQKQPCDCGWSVSTKIVNGKETVINEFPSMVALKDKTTSQPSFCAGAIISHKYIVTAAHCTRIQSNPNNLLAYVGRHNLNTATDTKYSAVYQIVQIIEHPQYSEYPVDNDIALLETSLPIDWSRGVGPICLPPQSSSSNTFAYKYVDVIGWGSTSFAGPTSPTLQKVNLMIIDNTTCANAYQDISPIYSSQLCTIDYSGSNKDSCQFDSGGPVVLTQYRQFLVGVISFGKGCGADGYAIGINTRITSYISWIIQNTGYSTCNVSM